MKKLIVILFFFILQYLNAQEVDSVSIIPTTPTTIDIISAHLFGTKAMSSDYIRRISISASQDSIFIKTYGMSCGGWAMVTSFDTYVELGKKPVGNYIVTIISCLDTNTIIHSCSSHSRFEYIDTITTYFQVLGVDNTKLINRPEIRMISNLYNTTTEISFDKNYDNIDLSFFDLQGKIIKMKAYRNCSKINFDRTDIANGFYFLKIILDKKIIETKKIIIAE